MSFTNRITVIALSLSAFVASHAVYAQQRISEQIIMSEERNSEDNSLKSLAFNPTSTWKLGQEQDLFSHYLGIMPGDNLQMVFKNETKTKSKSTVRRYVQYYKGIKVAHGGYTVTAKEDKISFMTGNFFKPVSDLSATPTLSEAAAFSKALAFVGATKYKWQNPVEEAHIKSEYNKSDTTYLPKGKLVWVEDRRSGVNDRKLHLAYSFDIYADEPMSRQDVYIDADDGHVLFVNQLIKHTAASGASRYSGVVPFQTSFVGGTYRLFDSTRGNGVYTRNMNNGTNYGTASQFTSATNTWPSAPIDNVALDAHWGGAIVYDYFQSQHGRLSWDGLNSTLFQYVHYSTNYNNAFWNGVSMTYGDGSGIASGGFSPLTSLDVTAHEVGHGVCQATCDLVYEREAGALNEAFSDCWAATIEQWSNPFEIDAMPKAPWDIGEEIGTEPLRSMNAPLLQGQPDTYGGTNWFNVVGCTPSGGNDYCGVHRNSGLMNYWYYLLVNGGTGTNDLSNSYIVNAMGWTKAAIILYETELVLSTTATYMDCRIASINVANTIFGPCSPEAQSVTSAWYAVGVGPNYVPCAPQIAFTRSTLRVSELVPGVACPATKTVNIGLKPNGPVIAGGSPVANLVVVGSSTAVAGIDYTLSTTSVTFPVGDTSTKFVTMTIFDDGDVNDDKRLDLAFTVSPMGSGAVVSPFNDSLTIFIDNNDSIPYTGRVVYPNTNVGIPVPCDFTSPFAGRQRRARMQYLLYASELQAAGVVPRVPISQLSLNVISKGSTAPFIGYTISMANTNVPDLYSAFVTAGLTQVYTGNFTTYVGTDSIDFNTGTFTWDGVSNVVVQFCYGMNAASAGANDIVAGVQQGEFIIGDYNTTSTGTGTGCTLGFSTGNRSVVRPIIKFKQVVPPSAIETTAASTRVINVKTGDEVYFYSPADTQVIAGIQGMDNDLGCVTASVTQQGNGVVPATFSPINRSLKEIAITPTINGSITTYEVTMYLTNTELAGLPPASFMLLKTTSASDATLNSANSVLVTPTLITGGNYVGFRGTFTGFGRYMLVDGPLCNIPEATITPTGPTTFCVGSDVLMNASPVGAGLGYQWQRNGVNIPGATATSYTATTGGNYTVIVNQSLCDSTSLPITVTLDSAYAAPITGSATVCIGQTTTLSSASSGGVWSSSSSSTATVSATGVVTGISAGTVTITYTVTNGCGSADAMYTMTVNIPTSLPATTGIASVCVGTATTLTNTFTGGVWSSGNLAIATVNAGGLVSSLTAGTVNISYSYTNGVGCVSNAIRTVTVNPIPVATISPSGSVVICTGVSATLTASPLTGHTYQWQIAGTDIAGATSGTFVTSAAGNYRVIVTSSAGCTATSAPVVVTISAAAVVTPSVSISSSAGFTLCTTSTPVTFTATPVNGGATPAYQWFINGSPVAGTTNSYAYIPSNGDLVSVQLTSSELCAIPATATNAVTMVVNPSATPAVSITASPNDTVCTGDMVTYSAVPVWGGSAPEFLWTENGTNVATGPMYLTWPMNGDVIVCRMTSNYPCLSTTIATSAPFIMNVQSPSVNTVSVTASAPGAPAGVPITFIANAPNAGISPTYQWFVSGLPISGATNMTFTTNSLSNGQVVSCMVTSSLLCASPRTTTSAGFTVNITTGIEQAMQNGNKLILSPNPNNGKFAISGKIAALITESVQVSVINMLGQEVFSTSTSATSNELNMPVVLPSNIAPGMYLVSVKIGEQKVMFHVSVEK